MPTKKNASTDWEARFDCGRSVEVKVLEKPFAGIPAGARMLIVTPRMVDAVVRDVPHGCTIAPPALRQTIARQHGADHACPVTTGLSLRVVAERAWLRLARREDDVAPFWRAVDPASELAGKLACGPGFIADRRAEEARVPARSRRRPIANAA